MVGRATAASAFYSCCRGLRKAGRLRYYGREVAGHGISGVLITTINGSCKLEQTAYFIVM
jgi:hypothetical protein